MDNIIESAVKKLFGVETSVVLTRPDAQFGDYATNIALQISKQIGKNPREIAQQITDELRESGKFLDVSVAGPGFINIRVSAEYLHQTLSDSWSAQFGENNDGQGKTVVVEYPSPNMAKPYSVGHLRPGNQGWAAKRLMEASGWNVITDNHLGDYGAPFGIWVAGFLKFSSEEALEKDGVYELGRVYIKMKKALKEEKEAGGDELATQVQDWLLRLESGDEEATRYSYRFNQISLDHIHNVMNRLKISTQYELGESFFVKWGKRAIKKLVEQNVAIKNQDGSIIVPLEEFGFDVPLLVQKSNGAALYATSDLATILYREDEWKPDRVIYSVGAEQQFYFAQLFAMAKKLGIKTELIHLWFGTIDQVGDDGLREKMSSRKGVVLMEQLLDQAEARARQLVGDRKVSEDDIKKIALGAIKFSDFVSDRRTNILFDWDTIFALSGFSGPYIQYAAVRVNKILSEHGRTAADLPSDYDGEPEKSLIIKMLDYPAVVKLSARDLEPHQIASYLYELARELNRYYEVTPVAVDGVPESQKQFRLGVLDKVSYIFNHGLGILGIEVPRQM